MADVQQPRIRRDVIPLHPGRVPEHAWRWLPPLLDRLRTVRSRLRIPPELLHFLSGIGGKAVEFTAPGILLAAGVAVLALLAGFVAAACGMKRVDAASLGLTAGGWTLLGTTGYALLKRGWSLALLRWR